MKIPFGKYIFLGASLIILGSCLSNSEKNTSAKGIHFFDASDYFNKEIKRLNASKNSVLKNLYVNEKQDTIRGQVDFEKELDAFVKSNINKTSLYDKYQVDSIFNSVNLLEKETYTALDSTLRTRIMTIEYDSSQVLSSIFIQNRSDNAITKAIQSLSYQPNKMYSIRSEQKTIASDKSISRIEARIIEE